MYKIKRFSYVLLQFLKYITGNVKPYLTPKKSKSAFKIFIDLLKWLIKERNFNSMYYAFGLNQKGAAISDYLGNRSLAKIRFDAEKILRQRIRYECGPTDVVIKDKFYCNSILKANKIPVVENLAILIHGEYIGLTHVSEKLSSYSQLSDGEYLAKSITKEGGEGIICYSISGGSIIYPQTDVMKNMLGQDIWLIQQRYESHQKLKIVNNSALNTTRIYTVMGLEGPTYLAGYQTFATNNAIIDSGSHGSIYVKIDTDTCMLGDYGITSISDNRPGILYNHPDSLVKFKNFELPYLKESINICLNAHRFFYSTFLIGWDVAITDEGPLILEGNEKPGIQVLQVLAGGIQQRLFQKYNELRKRNE